MIVYILNCYIAYPNNEYIRDVYIGKSQNFTKLKYRMTQHYNSKGYFTGIHKYNIVDLGHIYNDKENEVKYDLEKAFINLSEWDLEEICRTHIGEEHYLFSVDHGEIDVDLGKQFCHKNPMQYSGRSTKHFIPIRKIINKNKNERGKMLSVKCIKCGRKREEKFDPEKHLKCLKPKCLMLNSLCQWDYDWAEMVNELHNSGEHEEELQLYFLNLQ